MTRWEIDGIKVDSYGDYSEEEVKSYIAYYKEKHGEWLRMITLRPVEDNPDEVDTECVIANKQKFHRIRRITGYCVGSLDRFNDAKKSEVEDRLKHGV